MPHDTSTTPTRKSSSPLIILGLLSLAMLGASRLPPSLSLVATAVWGVGAVAGLAVIVRQFRSVA